MRKKNKDNGIASEFAIMIILLVAIIIGGIIWIRNARKIAELTIEEQKNDTVVIPVKRAPAQVVDTENVAADNSCQPHYYDGDVQIEGQFVSQDKDGIVIAIKKSDVSKLPVVNYQPNEAETSFNVKLIDPTDKVNENIKASSAKKPITITVHGYAEICQPLPVISLQPATVAFKGQS